MNYTNYTVATNFGVSGIGEYKSTAAVPLVTSIVLPDNSQYSFQYEATPGSCTPYSGTTCTTARLTSVTLPTGGTITYSYSGGNNGILSDGSTATLTRKTPDGTWTYAQAKGTGAASTTTVTDPAGNATTINFQGIYETQRTVTLSYGTQTTNTCYNTQAPPAPTCTGTAVTLPITKRYVTTQLAGGNLTDLHYQTFDNYGNPTEQDDYDYGAGSNGALLKKTTIMYAPLGNNITAFQQQVTVTNGSGATVSQTNYNYDQGTVQGTTGTPQHTSISGSRGNLTSVNHYTQGSTYLTASYTYFDTGNVQTATDVNGAQTTYTYGACGNSFPTTVSEPLSMSKTYTWDTNCTGGVVTSVKDENNQTTTITYNDPYFWRPYGVTDQLLNETFFGYVVTGADTNLFFNNSQVNTGYGLDGLGRLIQVSHIHPGYSIWDQVVQSFDTNGRPWKTSMPCTTTGPWTCPITASTTTYDALNRPHIITDGGGGTTTYTYSQNDVLVAVTPVPSGENPKQRQLEYDALGRLTSVCEITTLAGSSSCAQNTAANGYLTKYTYNALGQLTGVTQNAQSSSTQTRTYVYDLLGRLTSETNPESGTVSYQYDTSSIGWGGSSGDLTTRTDNAGNVICYHYDQLHRLTDVAGWRNGTWYSGNGPYKRFRYDLKSNGVVSPGSGWALSNLVGRLVEVETDISNGPITDEWFSYTARGEVSDVWESTPNSGGYYHANETYWANGLPSQLNGYYSSGTSSYSALWNPDSQGRVYSSNTLSSVSYNAASQPTQLTFSSGDSDSFTYDPNTNRMTQYQFNVNGQFVTGNLVWNFNGTLGNLGIIDAFNGANAQNCNYSHDDLVRIASVNCQGNQLQNPGFEQGTTGYSIGASSGATGQVVTNSQQAHSGNNYLQLSSPANGQVEAWGSEVNASPGSQVTFGGWAFLQSGSNNCCQGWWLAVYDSNNNAIAYVGANPAPSASGWTYESNTYTVPSNGAHVQLYAQVWNPTATTVLWADDGFLNTNSVWAQNFSYDAFGNIAKSGSSAFQATYSPSTNHMSQIAGQTPSYDADGEVLNDFLHNYTWNAYGQAATIDSVGLTYDALGRMVEQNRSGTYTQILYSPTGFMMSILNGQTVAKNFVPLPGGAMTVFLPSSYYYRHADWLGSSRFASTSSRTMYSDTAYAPFGEAYAQAGTTDVNFTGMDQNTVPNLYDFPAREYAGAQGRWPSPDPAGLAAVDPTNPQSWNRYAYVLNNPLTSVDPLGLVRCPFATWNCGDGGPDGGDGCTMDGVGTPCSIFYSVIRAGGASLCLDAACTIRGDLVPSLGGAQINLTVGYAAPAYACPYGDCAVSPSWVVRYASVPLGWFEIPTTANLGPLGPSPFELRLRKLAGGIMKGAGALNNASTYALWYGGSALIGGGAALAPYAVQAYESTNLFLAEWAAGDFEGYTATQEMFYNLVNADIVPEGASHASYFGALVGCFLWGEEPCPGILNSH